jgi:hypothetical protein
MRKTLFGFALLMLCMGTALSYFDKVGGAVATYTAAFLCLVFVYLSEFELFKAFGAEARLRKKINEADEILQRLREVTLPIAELLFAINARVGLWSAPVPRRDSYRIMKQIEEELRLIGVRPEGLEKARREYDRRNIFDLTRPLIKGFTNALDAKKKGKRIESENFTKPVSADKQQNYMKLQEERARLDSFRKDLEKFYQIEEVDTLPSAIDDSIKKCEFLIEEEKEDLFTRYREEMDDLKYYIKHHDFRRLETWFEGDED